MHADFSPDQPRNQSPSARRRDVFGEGAREVSFILLILFGPKCTDYLACGSRASGLNQNGPTATVGVERTRILFTPNGFGLFFEILITVVECVRTDVISKKKEYDMTRVDVVRGC